MNREEMITAADRLSFRLREIAEVIRIRKSGTVYYISESEVASLEGIADALEAFNGEPETVSRK